MLLLLALASGSTLAQTATIEGTVTEGGSGTPLAGVTVVVTDPNFPGAVVASQTTSGSGTYSISINVPSGGTRTVRVEAAGTEHLPARYGFSGTLNCFFGCATPGGEFTASDGVTTTGIDISLQPGGARLAGVVTANDTGLGLENVRISFIPSGSSTAYSRDFHGVADINGDYLTPFAVPPGEYHVLAEPAIGSDGISPATYADNYVPEAWNDRACEFLRCPLGNTDTVTLVDGDITANIDFALEPGAELSGELGPDNVEKVIALYGGAGERLRVKVIYNTDLPQTNWTFNGLSGGSYYVQLGPLNFSNYLRQLHNGLACPYSGCERASGSALNIPPGASLALPLTTMDSGGQIDGVVIDGTTNSTPAGSPANARLGTYDIIDANGDVVGGGAITTDAGGAISLDPSFAVPPGNYYVRTYNEFLGDALGDLGYTFNNEAALPGYMDAVFPDQPCAGIRCDLGAASPVSVTAGNTASIILEVETGSVIDGTVVDSVSGLGMPDTLVRVINLAGDTLSVVETDSNGNFRFGALPAGDYWVRTSVSGFAGPGDFGVQNAYFDQLYGAANSCSEALCDPASGTMVTLDGSNDLSLGNLEVRPGPVISGQIVEVPTGYVLPRGQVDVFTDTGDFVGSYKVNVLEATYQTTALPSGTYTVVPNVSPVYNVTTGSGGTTPARAPNGTQSSEGIQVTIDTESVELNLSVVDVAFDRLFSDQFKSEGQ